jgi:hypothetical protein
MELNDYKDLVDNLLGYLVDLKETHGAIELLLNMGYDSQDLMDLGFDYNDILISFEVLLKQAKDNG